MKVPEPRKVSSGKWFIQMRLNGESVTVSDYDKKKCIREAQAIKAEYLAGKRLPPPKEKESPTLTEAIDRYIEDRENTLSPLTIRGYRIIQKHRFQAVMNRRLSDIADSEWQSIVNEEAKTCSAKTLKNAYLFIRGVVHVTTGHAQPEVTLPQVVPRAREFLEPDQIKVFVKAVAGTKYAVPLLLALSSLRISEIQALRWEDIPPDPRFIRVTGAVVLNEHNQYARKEQTKNASSTRSVPILIPELSRAIERDRQNNGPVLTITQNSLRCALKRICKANDLPDVSIHGLRHSFASLAYHLQMPEKIAMEIGGWSDSTTMHNIYTHIAKSDLARYQNAMQKFYEQ